MKGIGMSPNVDDNRTQTGQEELWYRLAIPARVNIRSKEALKTWNQPSCTIEGNLSDSPNVNLNYLNTYINESVENQLKGFGYL